jgi:hypothetical protein
LLPQSLNEYELYQVRSRMQAMRNKKPAGGVSGGL